MKALPFIIMSLLWNTLAVLAQQPENGSFETWELIPEISLEEPVDWSSIKTSDGGSIINNAAPQCWSKSTDAHTGGFSLKLENKTSFSIVVTGTLTNGRAHAEFNPAASFIYSDTGDSRWNTPITARPDSLIGWYKQTPSGVDFATAKALVHKGFARIPDASTPGTGWIGLASFNAPNATVGEWTRFAVPFDYYSSEVPEYVLIILTSGNGTSAVTGSMAWFDDLELVYGPSGIGQAGEKEQISISYQHGAVHITGLSEDQLRNTMVELVDLSGRIVWSGKAGNGKVLPGQPIMPGLMICRLMADGIDHSVKLIIP